MILLTFLNCAAFGFKDFLKIQQKDLLLAEERPTMMFKRNAMSVDNRDFIIRKLSMQISTSEKIDHRSDSLHSSGNIEALSE